jgi:halimadienyl-diphosphate synthase
VSATTSILPTAYDTAWIASIPSPASPEVPLFPQALEWLVGHQLNDGSWGSSIPCEQDRLLSTLAGAVALERFAQSAMERTARDSARGYLQQPGRVVAGTTTDLVGFELLLPALVERAQRAGIPVSVNLDVYNRERTAKLRLIPPAALYSPEVTIVHSLEFLGEQADVAGLRRAQGANGSIGNSPAATAFFFSLTHDSAALAYLESCIAAGGGAAAPVLHPCDMFDRLWSAYHLHLAGIPVRGALGAHVRQQLREQLTSGGVSLDPTFPIPDADDTAVALILLSALGEDVDPRVLRAFEVGDGHFRSFPFERHASVGVNVHVLHSLLAVPGYEDRARHVEELVDYVVGQQTPDGYWLDKWHISPLYATAHAIAVFTQLRGEPATFARPALERAERWLLETQHADGAWGHFGRATAEETAYAVLALAALDTHNPGASCRIAREKGLSSLESLLELETPTVERFPAMWIDKCLYMPTDIVRAVVRAAQENRNLPTRQPELVA